MLMIVVFLRILEYYSGILFLTTNRVGTSDGAFRSRLHLTLYYPKLTRKQRREIFKRNFKRIGEINAYRLRNKLLPYEYNDCEPKVMVWAKETWKTLRWNGRQIRSTFQTVLTLAEFQARNHSGELTTLVVKKKHFSIVANASIQFNKYLFEVHGADEDKVAKREFMPAAGYSSSPELLLKGVHQDSFDSSSEDGTSEGSGTNSNSDDSDRKRKKGFEEGEIGKEAQEERKG
ncbi:hypothetical protein F4776DRAFT_220241 [Hypoxylon sp. NC0597]|nr:hypothetical protein F4776DRAFT_220241 [Hypoxylon sp. NC0597]